MFHHKYHINSFQHVVFLILPIQVTQVTPAVGQLPSAIATAPEALQSTWEMRFIMFKGT